MPETPTTDTTLLTQLLRDASETEWAQWAQAPDTEERMPPVPLEYVHNRIEAGEATSTELLGLLDEIARLREAAAQPSTQLAHVVGVVYGYDLDTTDIRLRLEIQTLGGRTFIDLYGVDIDKVIKGWKLTDVGAYRGDRCVLVRVEDNVAQFVGLIR